MEYPTDFLNNIKSSKLVISDMIEQAIKQGMLNFNMLYTLQDGLNELHLKVENSKKLDTLFLKKWDKVMGWVPKVFEGHPFLDLLREIDMAILNYHRL